MVIRVWAPNNEKMMGEIILASHLFCLAYVGHAYLP
jgi:hypothetical protein